MSECYKLVLKELLQSSQEQQDELRKNASLQILLDDEFIHALQEKLASRIPTTTELNPPTVNQLAFIELWWRTIKNIFVHFMEIILESLVWFMQFMPGDVGMLLKQTERWLHIFQHWLQENTVMLVGLLLFWALFMSFQAFLLLCSMKKMEQRLRKNS
jgi:hypothetical protein